MSRLLPSMVAHVGMLWRLKVRPPVKRLVYKLRSRVLYRLADFYIDTVNNDHDCDFSTNGEAAFVRECLRDAKVVFDIGAAKGTWTELALAANSELFVHCFEPASERVKMIEALNFRNRIRLNKVALGESPGAGEMFIEVDGGSNSLFAQRYGGKGESRLQTETVPITTIDRYCETENVEHVDFIKMDIEGYEMAALRGAQRVLKEGRVDVIQFEYSSTFLDAGASLLQLWKYVTELNPAYEFHKIYPDGIKHVPAYSHELDNFKTQNWVMIKR